MVHLGLIAKPRIQLAALVACLGWAACSSTAPATGASGDGRPEVVFTGYDRFADVVEVLRADEDATAAEWAALLTAPGYDQVLESLRHTQVFRAIMVAAFRPSASAQAGAMLARGGAEGFLVEHLREYDAERSRLDAWRAKVLDQDWIARCFARTAAYLPRDLQIEGAAPQVRFIAFMPDGTADVRAIAADLLTCAQMSDEDFEGFLAHELHHVYVRRLMEISYPDRKDPRYDLFHSLSQLQLEGVADLIDKRAILYATERPRDEYGGDYYDLMWASPATFVELDARIVAFAGAEGEEARAIAAEIRASLPYGAHPHGGYMARVVRDAAGDEAVVATLGNPFDFVRAYNAAAPRSRPEAHVFSPEAMAVLDELEASLRSQ